MTGETGTVRWMAPEAFRGDPYSLKVDIYRGPWSLGLLCAARRPTRKRTKDLRRDRTSSCTTGLLSRAVHKLGVASLLSLAWAGAGDRPEAARLFLGPRRFL